MPHRTIQTLQEGDEFTRRRLAIYCIKDAYIPMRLLSKLQVIFNLIETCRVCGMPVDFLFTRGQQIKVASQIYRYARRLDFCVPMRSNYTYHVEKFEGATVIEPARGFYLEPVATLDFSSLYPSIMVAHNLCYTTLIP